MGIVFVSVMVSVDLFYNGFGISYIVDTINIVKGNQWTSFLWYFSSQGEGLLFYQSTEG